jgi:MFS transporter, UMF1 family
VAAEHQNDPGSIRAWITYDWANSAYATTILAAVLPSYFAAEVVGDDGFALFGRSIALFFVAGGVLFRSVAIDEGRRNRYAPRRQ